MSDDFSLRMNGQFWGILHWTQLDDLWSRVRAEPEGWYASLIGEAVPESPIAVDTLHNFVADVDSLLRREHEYDYCGIVYADDMTQSGLIKIFDPQNLGSSCGCSGAKIPPRWVLSRIKPSRIEDDAPLPNARKRWWRGLFG